MEAYCLYCRDKMKMKDTKAVTLKNGWVAIYGICPVCSSTMFRIKTVKSASLPLKMGAGRKRLEPVKP